MQPPPFPDHDPDDARPGVDRIVLRQHDVLPTAEAAVVDAGIAATNDAVPALAEVQPLGCFAQRGADRRVLGGAVGRTWGRCAELQQLWVDADYRQRGLGSRLLCEFESAARARGCDRVYLETFSFQAPDWYAARGYETVLAIDGYGSGIVRHTMMRRWPPDDVSGVADGRRVPGS